MLAVMERLWSATGASRSVRRLLACLVAVLLAAPVAVYGGAGTPPSGLSTYVFQNGTASDGSASGSYSGCAATYIAARDGGAGRNRGGCDTLNVSSLAGTYGQQITLIKFDISDLPDDAIIWRARLWLYQINPSGTSVDATTYSQLAVYRLLLPFTEGPGACAGAQNGYADSDSAGGGIAWKASMLTPAIGASGKTASWITGTLTAADSSTVGAGGYAGVDTLSGYPIIAYASLPADVPTDVLAMAAWRNGNTAAKRLGSVTIDITDQARRWHNGMNLNNGVAVMDFGEVTTATIAFASDEYPYRLRRPKLVVEYVTPSSGSGAVRRVVGGRR